RISLPRRRGSSRSTTGRHTIRGALTLGRGLMRQGMQARLILAAALVLVAGTAGRAAAQAPNSQPNPYRTVEGWAKMPDGRTWGSTSAVEIDPDEIGRG